MRQISKEKLDIVYRIAIVTSDFVFRERLMITGTGKTEFVYHDGDRVIIFKIDDVIPPAMSFAEHTSIMYLRIPEVGAGYWNPASLPSDAGKKSKTFSIRVSAHNSWEEIAKKIRDLESKARDYQGK